MVSKLDNFLNKIEEKKKGREGKKDKEREREREERNNGQKIKSYLCYKIIINE